MRIEAVRLSRAVFVMKMVEPLEPPDVHYLRAAIGWLQLGNHVEANAELEGIMPGLRVHPDVLQVRWQIQAQAKNWDACVAIACVVVELDPNRASAWMDLAYSLRRAVNAGLQAAWNALIVAAEKFPTEPLIPFNLSCYACQMGRMEDACNWLRVAFAIAANAGDKKRLKLMALNQPDLEPLRSKIGQLSR